MKVYYDKDCDLSFYENKTIAIIGYGSQGRAQALNLKESGVKVLVGQRAGSKNYVLAEKDGFTPLSAEAAAERADLIHLLVPDELQKALYESAIKPHLTPGKALLFSHGFNIHYGLITPPKEVDVYLVAPKGPGHTVRREYEAGGGIPALIAIANDATGKAKHLALAHAKGIGSSKAGVLETSFKEETETDLFGEQAVLCGGLVGLIMAGFETLVEAGYAKEMAYFECVHELKLIIDLIYESGIAGMAYSISETAEYGSYKTAPRLMGEAMKKHMRKVLKEIQNGVFAKDFVQEANTGKLRMKAERRLLRAHEVEKVGRELRSLMTSLFKNKLVDEAQLG